MSERLRQILRKAGGRRLDVRHRVAELLGQIGRGEGTETLLERLARDPVAIVREAAADSLRRLLERSDPLTRTRIVAEWATSSSGRVRAVVACALAGDLQFVGQQVVMEHLARDPSAEVRQGVSRAAGARLGVTPRSLRVLDRLASDNRRSVRLAALGALRRAVRAGLGREALPTLTRSVTSADPLTAREAVETLSRVAHREPEEALRAFEHITDAPGELHPEVAERVVDPVRRVACVAPRRSERILRRLTRSPEPFVREAARDALEQEA